ncbi:putative ribonuclease H-like domain-containing protein, partial [Tanacetum coccineum]
GNPEEDLKDYAIIDSGCSGSMTGDKDKLSDFKEFKGGYVAFGNDPKGGRITGKGTIKTSCIDFEKVSYVEELKFNLLSVSQICDKKHNVLFTDKECLILSPKFKFVDEDLATKDEAVLWHRRLGHVNFKNINKLVKGNLVRGLPSKTFKLDHSCLACRKGKQHRASCKKIEERTVREPLELLHMDLFRPVSVESINRKKELTACGIYWFMVRSINASQNNLLEELTADKEVSHCPLRNNSTNELVILMHQESIANKKHKKDTQALAIKLGKRFWGLKAIARRTASIQATKCMGLCDLPDGKRVIGTKWVFRNKRDERGSIIKNKARLVAQGYRQEMCGLKMKFCIHMPEMNNPTILEFALSWALLSIIWSFKALQSSLAFMLYKSLSFSDSDYAGDNHDRHQLQRMFITLGEDSRKKGFDFKENHIRLITIRYTDGIDCFSPKKLIGTRSETIGHIAMASKDAHGTSYSKCCSKLVFLQVQLDFQGTSWTFPRYCKLSKVLTAEAQVLVLIFQQSPNDYTPTDESPTSEEIGTFGSISLNREDRGSRGKTLSQANRFTS